MELLKGGCPSRTRVKNLTSAELLWGPILASLLVNLRRGTSANGSSNDKITWTHHQCTSRGTIVSSLYKVHINCVWVDLEIDYWFDVTEAMMMSLEAPDAPPIMQITRLGAIAMILVTEFLNHSFIFRSRKPCSQVIANAQLNSQYVGIHIYVFI